VSFAKVEARLQGRRGPRVLQPYYDLGKLVRKESLAPEGASWFFLAAPLVAVAAYLTIPLLIPVLTTYGLPLGYMGDILGGGFLLVVGELRHRGRSAGSCCSSCSRWHC
jgi:formate hydrogenlyase subunit 4